MKSKYILVVLLLISTVAIFASEKVLEFLHAESNGKTITVSWKAVAEDDVSLYAVERAGDDMIFSEVASEHPQGLGTTYRYIDESAFKDVDIDNKTQANTNYYYRIVIKKTNNSKIISDNTLVKHSTSGIKRTWGMLKEMFR